jgi:hypothetical protein
VYVTGAGENNFNPKPDAVLTKPLPVGELLRTLRAVLQPLR